MGSERAASLATGGVAGLSAGERLKVVADRARPITLAREQSLPVAPTLGALFPSGLRRGATITVRGDGALSFGFALVATASAAGSWIVLIGIDDANLMAAHELGVALERVVVVQPPVEQWSATVAAAIGAFDVVVLSARHRVSGGDTRRLMSRARERGSVLLASLGARSWPERVDAELSITTTRWHGLGQGHGHLQSRLLQIDMIGRRELSRPRRLELMMPGAAPSTPAPSTPAPSTAATAVNG